MDSSVKWSEAETTEGKTRESIAAQIETKPAPWGDPSRGLWSLIEMLRAYAAQFAEITRALMDCQHSIVMQSSLLRRDEVRRATCERIGEWLEKANGLCVELGLLSVPPKIQRVLQRLHRTEMEALMHELYSIRERIEDELGARMFYYVETKFQHYYQNASLFGMNVSQKFPDAAPDIEEAGNCYALGRPTACVLHLMRVLEVGVKTLAGHHRLNHVPGPKETMAQVAVEIQKKATALSATTHADKEEKEKLLRAAVHFQAVTGAWRNPNMHTPIFYTPEQAKIILDHVSAFMQSLTSLL